VHWNSRSNKSI